MSSFFLHIPTFIINPSQIRCLNLSLKLYAFACLYHNRLVINSTKDAAIPFREFVDWNYPIIGHCFLSRSISTTNTTLPELLPIIHHRLSQRNLGVDRHYFLYFNYRSIIFPLTFIFDSNLLNLTIFQFFERSPSKFNILVNSNYHYSNRLILIPRCVRSSKMLNRRNFYLGLFLLYLILNCPQ